MQDNTLVIIFLQILPPLFTTTLYPALEARDLVKHYTPFDFQNLHVLSFYCYKKQKKRFFFRFIAIEQKKISMNV